MALKKNYLTALVVSMAFAAPAVAPAAILVDFTPVPVGPNVVYAGTPGSKTLTITSNLVNLRSAINIPSIAAPIVDGYEIFDDTQFILNTPFFQNGAAVDLDDGAATQKLNLATFTFVSSPAYGSVVLLQGSFGASRFFGDTTVGSILSPTVEYTGGVLKDLIPIDLGTSTLSLSLLTPTLGVASDSLNDFFGRVQGQLTTPVIPEPASMGLAGAAAALLLGRRRRA